MRRRLDVSESVTTTGCKPATASDAVKPATGSAIALSNRKPMTILLHRRSTALAAEVSAKPSSRTLKRIPEGDSTNALLFAQKCTFFKWCDKATDEDIRFRPAFTIPDCPCGSGPCRRVVADSGRAYLQCGVKKGFGACGFFKWVDDVEVRCDAADEIGFWEEADLVLSDVESSFLAAAAGVPENTEDDSSVSDVHSAPAAVNQGILMSEPVVIEKLHGDQPLSKLSVDEEATSGLGRDTVSNGSVAKREMICYEQPVEESEWSFPDLDDLMEQYNSEKLQLESVSAKHVQVLSEFMSSYSRLRLLHEKTGNLRKLLLETEKEMASCEAKALELGASCREVAGEMAEAQNRMQVMAAILGDEVELLKQKEFVGRKRRRC
uniref:GRF-type domain-containing protein n=1 Tax=Brassica oleracea var. oleracea TaxID=109376 RepID=A0A0D3B110_BRAOL